MGRHSLVTILFFLFLCDLMNAKASEKMGMMRAPAEEAPRTTPSFAIVPEILRLKDMETLPEKILLENDSRLVGKSIVTRLTLNQEKELKKNKPPKNPYDFYNDSEIQLAFKDKIFSLIRRGCFKNQHQTNTSNGGLDTKVRVEAENILGGIKIRSTKDPSHPENYVRPKYAYLVPTKPMTEVNGNNYVPGYGNIFAVFKQDVKERTTFTPMDSLEMPTRGYALKGIRDYKKIRENKFYYWEAQVWGEVCLSDVSHFLVNCPDQEASSPKVIAEMKETGIPVYKCELEMRGENVIYVKGKNLFPEDLERRALDESKVISH